jgi:hypothetical protein
LATVDQVIDPEPVIGGSIRTASSSAATGQTLPTGVAATAALRTRATRAATGARLTRLAVRSVLIVCVGHLLAALIFAALGGSLAFTGLLAALPSLPGLSRLSGILAAPLPPGVRHLLRLTGRGR